MGILLETKLNMPQPSINHIPRSRITKMLDTAYAMPFILVSAPAGSGKSVLVSEWLSSLKTPQIWYGLDDWDNDFQQFMSYIAEGVKPIDCRLYDKFSQLISAFPTIGERAFIQSAVALFNELETRMILTLDDYHLIHDKAITKLVHYLIEHASSKVQIILITREDPDLPLSSLRLSGKLFEVRSKDLKFNLKESEQLLQSHLTGELDRQTLQMLHNRTEGWAAGLQLTALSMNRGAPSEDFVTAFTGNNLYIIDFLVNEVFSQQAESLQKFLVLSANFDKFCCELCDHTMNLTAGTSHAFIDQLSQKNMFIIPLDSDGVWFRYHHLFADILKQRCANTYPIHIQRDLLRSAGDWYKSRGRHTEAVRYYLKSEDYESAAALLECMWSEMDLNLQAQLWIGMANDLPKALIKKRPVLSLGYGWALIDTGHLDDSIIWFDNAARLHRAYISRNPDLRGQSGDPQEDIFISDTDEFELLPASLATAYGYIAASRGDIEGLVHHANTAKKELSSSNPLKQGVIYMMSGFANWSMGQFEAAEKEILLGLYEVEKLKDTLTANSFHMVLAELYTQQGLLNKAIHTLEETIDRITRTGQLPILLSNLYLGLAKIYYLRCESNLMADYMEKSLQASKNFTLMDWAYKYSKLQARLYISTGDYEKALEYIDRGKKQMFMNPIPDKYTFAYLDQLVALGKKSGPTALPDLADIQVRYTMQNDFECLAFQMLSTPKSALTADVSSGALKLNSLCQAFENLALHEGRLGDAVRFGVLGGRLLPLIDSTTKLDKAFSRAVEHAAENKYFRPFADQLPERDYQRLLPIRTKSRVDLLANRSLSEPLTERELDVLELIEKGYSNKDIADELFLALSTVKGYIQNIYGKLEVKRRTEAIAKAHKIGLISGLSSNKS